MSVYQSQVYWEAMLDRKDLWQGNFASGKPGRLPIFVHIQIENRQTGYFDNHWACYDEPERLLGFIRYVFLPTAFHQLADLIEIGERRVGKECRSRWSPYH